MTERRRLSTKHNQLASLAVEINREHGDAIQDAQAAVEHAIRCGELLLKAKRLVVRGTWASWVKSNLCVDIRQEQKYRRAAKHAEQIRANANPEFAFNLDKALRKLSTPRTPRPLPPLKEPSLEQLEEELHHIEKRREELLTQIEELKARNQPF